MSDPTDAPAGAGATALDRTPASEGFTTAELGNFLTQARENPDEPAERAEPATAETELAKADAGTPSEEPKGNDPEAEKLPPIERPRSWSKDADDDWNAIPRARQEKIAENEQARELDIRQRINDAAEKLKGLTAKEQEVEKARQKYVDGLVSQDSLFEREAAEKFPNIKSVQDVEFLANEAIRLRAAGDNATADQVQDYLTLWRAHNDKWVTLRAQKQEAESEIESGRKAKWSDFVKEQNGLLGAKIPSTEIEKYTPLAGDHLAAVGFTDSERSGFVGGEKISPFDHRWQRIILNSIKFEEIQKAKSVVSAKPVPPVQRPGASKPVGSANSDTVNKLSAQLERSGDTKDLGALIGAMRRA